MKNSILRTILVVALTISMIGCSFAGPKTQMFGISSNPAGADVIINSKSIGKTPIQCQVDRGEDLIIEIKKSGYHTAFRHSSSRLSKRGIWDIVGGVVILFPFFGLLSDGAWEHRTSTFNVILDKEFEEID